MLTLLGCSSEPIAGEPGAPCLTKAGETTPLFCVCGYPCVDGICVEDPNISCDMALAAAEPDIAAPQGDVESDTEAADDALEVSDVALDVTEADGVSDALEPGPDDANETDAAGTALDDAQPETEDAAAEASGDENDASSNDASSEDVSEGGTLEDAEVTE